MTLKHIKSQTRRLSWMRCPTGDQEVAGSTPAEVGNILSWRLIMKYFLRSFSPFRWFKKGSCQFLAKECAQYWLTALRTKPAQWTCGYVNWPRSTWPHWVDWAVKPRHKQNKITNTVMKQGNGGWGDKWELMPEHMKTSNMTKIGPNTDIDFPVG